MKYSAIFLLVLTLSPSLKAREQRQLLKCLGQEEKRFHLKKEAGPVVDLNQRLISELVQIPHIMIGPEDYMEICTGEKASESWKLLELSLRKGTDLFMIPENVQGMQRSMTEGMIEDYVTGSKEILLKFIAQIQTIAPTPTCLKEEIPELEQFFTEIKYLETDLDLKKIFQGKDQKIFDKLKNYPLAFEKCRARLRKKAKSRSTAEPKKS